MLSIQIARFFSLDLFEKMSFKTLNFLTFKPFKKACKLAINDDYFTWLNIWVLRTIFLLDKVNVKQKKAISFTDRKQYKRKHI